MSGTQEALPDDPVPGVEVTCPECDGEGPDHGPCPVCNGYGTVIEERPADEVVRPMVGSDSTPKAPA